MLSCYLPRSFAGLVWGCGGQVLCSLLVCADTHSLLALLLLSLLRLSPVPCALSPPPAHQAKQEPNEFIVLNAAAYHAGYNMGFNVAEVRGGVGALTWAHTQMGGRCAASLPVSSSGFPGLVSGV